MADAIGIHDLRLVLLDGRRMVLYRRRTQGNLLDERVRATVVAYRTFVAREGIADEKIYTDLLVEDDAGRQEFIALQRVTFLRNAADLAPSTVPASGF